MDLVDLATGGVTDHVSLLPVERKIIPEFFVGRGHVFLYLKTQSEVTKYNSVTFTGDSLAVQISFLPSISLTSVQRYNTNFKRAVEWLILPFKLVPMNRGVNP